MDSGNMSRQMLFIRNPTAGSFRSQGAFLDAAEVIFRSDYKVYLYSTRYGGDAARMVAENGSKYDRIVCFGGDGTLNEVINGLMQLEKRPELGYIPAGTTNDFASGLGLSKNPVQAARDACGGEVMELDIGEAGIGKYFSYVASFGCFVSASYTAPQDAKNILGYSAYWLEGIKSIADLHSYRLHVVSDGVDVEDDFIYGGVSNSTTVAGFLKLNKLNVDMSDGLFEVLMIKVPKSLPDLNRTINSILTRQFNADGVLFFKTAHVRMDCGEPFAWTVDGEFAGMSRSMELFNRHSAIKIVRPRPVK